MVVEIGSCRFGFSNNSELRIPAHGLMQDDLCTHSNTEMMFRRSPDLFYVPTFGSGSANVTDGPHKTVTKTLNPLIITKRLILMARHKSVSSGMPPTLRCNHPSFSILPSSPDPKLFCCRRYALDPTSSSTRPSIFAKQIFSRPPGSAMGTVSTREILPVYRRS